MLKSGAVRKCQCPFELPNPVLWTEEKPRAQCWSSTLDDLHSSTSPLFNCHRLYGRGNYISHVWNFLANGNQYIHADHPIDRRSMGGPHDKSSALVKWDPVLPSVLHVDLLLWTYPRRKSKLASWQPCHNGDGCTGVIQCSRHPLWFGPICHALDQTILHQGT